MAVNTNVGFRLGLQSSADAIIAAGTGAEEGSFSLTSDSHRLYIGAESMPYTENDTLKMKINSYSTKNGEKNQYEFQSIDNGLTWKFCKKL